MMMVVAVVVAEVAEEVEVEGVEVVETVEGEEEEVITYFYEKSLTYFSRVLEIIHLIYVFLFSV